VRVFNFLMLLILISAFSINANELKSSFVFNNKVEKLKMGDTLSATLRIWPVDKFTESEFDFLKNNKLFGVFYLVTIDSITPSENNADVLELKADFIVAGSKKELSNEFEFHGQKINAELPAMQIDEVRPEGSDFVIMDQSIENAFSFLKWIIVFAFGLLIIFIILKLFKKFKVIKVEDPILKYKEIFNRASTRNEFESIYKEKDFWIKLLPNITELHYDFFKTLNVHQYKKEWNHEIEHEVKTSFDLIRGSFDERN
jgi:hypothetical protein